MLLAEFLPSVIPPRAPVTTTIKIPNHEEMLHADDETLTPEDPMTPESPNVDNNSGLFMPIKIPMVSFQPILAASSEYILVNECTKRRNLLICIDTHLKKTVVRWHIPTPIIDALWCNASNQFLLLTESNIYSFDANISVINLVPEFVPSDNKLFKCFTKLEEDTIMIAYNEWKPRFIEVWKYNMNTENKNIWILTEHRLVNLTSNEFIEDMQVAVNDHSNFAMTIFNDLTEQWRFELRNIQSSELVSRAHLLPGRSITHNFRLASVQNDLSNISWLVFSSSNGEVVAIKSDWTKTKTNYKHPIRKIIQFQKQNLIVRSIEKVDIHLIE